MLAKQWLRKIYLSLLQDSKLPIAFINVNSGGVSNYIRKEIEKIQYKITGPGVPKIASTTSIDETIKAINNLQKSNFHIIITTTYHSSNILKETGIKANISIFDEAQYLVSKSVEETEFRHSMNVSSDLKIFMTATPVYTDSDEGRGMNNNELFGDILFQKSPKHMINAGCIVSPKMHYVSVKNNVDSIIDSKDYKNISNLILDCFKFHKNEIKKVSAYPNKIGAKILVICDGQMTLEGLMNSSNFKNINNIKVYAISTDYGIYIHGNGHKRKINNSDKEKLLEELEKLDQNDDVIILHVDMISEGLDVPGITGILPLRNCNKIKFLQNLGRSTRLHSYDRERIHETEELKIKDYKNYVKPYCYVILPYISENKNDFVERYINIIRSLRSEYDFDPSENIICDFINPAQTNTELEEDFLNKEIRSIKNLVQYTYEHIIEKEKKEKEEDEITDIINNINNKLSVKETINYIKTLN